MVQFKAWGHSDRGLKATKNTKSMLFKEFSEMCVRILEFPAPKPETVWRTVGDTQDQNMASIQTLLLNLASPHRISSANTSRPHLHVTVYRPHASACTRCFDGRSHTVAG